MQTAVINIKVEPTTKKQAQKIANKLGLSLSAVLHGYLRKFIRTRSIELSLEEPSAYLTQSLKESAEDIKKGFVSPSFDNAKDAVAWLKDSKAKYANQLHKKI